MSCARPGDHCSPIRAYLGFQVREQDRNVKTTPAIEVSNRAMRRSSHFNEQGELRLVTVASDREGHHSAARQFGPSCTTSFYSTTPTLSSSTGVARGCPAASNAAGDAGHLLTTLHSACRAPSFRTLCGSPPESLDEWRRTSGSRSPDESSNGSTTFSRRSEPSGVVRFSSGGIEFPTIGVASAPSSRLARRGSSVCFGGSPAGAHHL